MQTILTVSSSDALMAISLSLARNCSLCLSTIFLSLCKTATSTSEVTGVPGSSLLCFFSAKSAVILLFSSCSLVTNDTKSLDSCRQCSSICSSSWKGYKRKVIVIFFNLYCMNEKHLKVTSSF